jgi:hypothetical protein
MSRTQVGCRWVLGDGTYCGTKTRYVMRRDDDGNRYREYAAFCELHGAAAETQRGANEEDVPVYGVRVSQARGKPAPRVGRKMRWGPFTFTVQAVVSGPTVTRFIMQEFDNYELRVTFDGPDTESWRLYEKIFTSGKVCVEVLP